MSFFKNLFKSEKKLEDQTKDFWEGVTYAEHDYKELNGDFLIEYKDPNGLETKREFTLKKYFFAENQNDYFIQGMCHFRGANRTFRTSRIKVITNLETGETAKKPGVDEFFKTFYKESPFFAAEEIIKNFGMQMDCFIYLAKLDGRFTKIEKDIILKFLEKSNEIEMDDELQGYILNHLNNTKEKSQITIKKFLKDLKEESLTNDFFKETLQEIGNSTKKEDPIRSAGLKMLLEKC